MCLLSVTFRCGGLLGCAPRGSGGLGAASSPRACGLQGLSWAPDPPVPVDWTDPATDNALQPPDGGRRVSIWENHLKAKAEQMKHTQGCA